MKINYYLKKNHISLIFLFLATLLILPKWILSFSLFDEDIILRIINDVSDATYFPIINSFSDLNFSNSYSGNIDNLKLISYPIIGLFVNSFFFKILGGFSFILLELVCTTLFLWIFYNIFLLLNFYKWSSLALSVFFFILPLILKDIATLDIESLKILSLNFESFYSTRFPRPAISNLFFFGFIFFIIKFYKDDTRSIKNTFIITILISFTINIFFYLFFIEFFLLIIIFYLKFRNNLFVFLLNNFKHFFYCLLILLFFLIIFQSQIFFSEPDYVRRLGVFNINSEQKKILFEYLYNFIFGAEFLFLILINTIFLFLTNNKDIKIFYYLFISSIISPIFFFMILDKGVDYYHFFNWIVITGFLFPLISTLYFLDNIFVKYLKAHQHKSLIFIFIFCSLFYSSLNNFLNFKTKASNESLKRYELNEITKFIYKNELFEKKNIEILNLNYELSIWLLLNDFNNFSIIPVSFWTPKTDYTIENELISSIKFLGLDKKNFNDLIENKMKSWRFKNEFVFNYFGRKYLANSLVSFNNNNSDYTQTEKNFMLSNNLLISHQVIIPKSEIDRLLKKFEKDSIIINPDIVIIDNEVDKKIDKFNNDDFCLIFKNNRFSIYSNNKSNPKCLLSKN
jgi:hypothetical protein